MAWIDASQCLPVPGRTVHVWGNHTPPPWPLPFALFDRRHGWLGTEWRASVGITHWWDGPKHPTRPPASSGVTTRFHANKRARKVAPRTAPPVPPVRAPEPPPPAPGHCLRQRTTLRHPARGRDEARGAWMFPADLDDGRIKATLRSLGFHPDGGAWPIVSAYGGLARAGAAVVRRQGSRFAFAHQTVEFLYA